MATTVSLWHHSEARFDAVQVCNKYSERLLAEAYIKAFDGYRVLPHIYAANWNAANPGESPIQFEGSAFK